MRIWLADLCCLEDGNATAVIPLGIGYIASYLVKNQPDVKCELFKNPIKLVDAIDDAEEPPAILALSSYTWNTNLNFAISKRMREKHPNTFIVMGGPGFDKQSPDYVKKFFLDRPQLNLYITDEGEWSFNKFIELFRGNNCNFDINDSSKWPDTFFTLNRNTNKIITNETIQADRIELSEIPSPYLNGILDVFLDEGALQPIIETTRGCPYSCTFCSWGTITKSHLYQFPDEIVYREIDYIAKKIKHKSSQLYLADGNFGILKRDLEIARYIQKISEKTGFPKRTYTYFAKNVTSTIIDIATCLKSLTRMAMSKQSMNKNTLDLIKRTNIKQDKYDELRKECEARGIDTFCEFIYGLPGEDYESFINGCIETIRSKQVVYLQILRMDDGAEISTSLSRKTHGMKTAYRILPRSAWNYKDIYNLEYDEVIAENKYMSREDIFRARVFHFILFILTNKAFRYLQKSLAVYGLDYGTFANLIAKDSDNWTPLWRETIESFREAAKKELIPPEMISLEFSQEDLDKVRNDETALNPFFFSQIVAKREKIEDLKNYFKGCVVKFFGGKIGDEGINEIQKTIDFSIDTLVCFEDLNSEKEVFYEYDLDSWMLDDSSSPLERYRKEEKIRYLYTLDKDIKPAFDKEIKKGKDIEHAVYYLRMHALHLNGDRIFYYKSETKQGSERS